MKTEARLSHLLGRRAVPAIAAVVVFSFLLMAALMVKIAFEQDSRASAQAARFAETSLARGRDEIGRSVKDYAAWGEAYLHLHATTDVDWAYVQQNLGPTLYRDLSVDDVLVVGPNGVITYAVLGGELTPKPPRDLLSPDLLALVDTAREAPPNEAKPAVAYVVIAGRALVAAASAITTGGDPTIKRLSGPPSVLVFADVLTPERMLQIGQDGSIAKLGVTLGGESRPVSASLSAPTPRSGGLEFAWEPERPGSLLLRQVLPWLAFAAVGFGLLIGLILRRAVKTAEIIETSTRALTQAHRQAEYTALHDAVTLLPNRLQLHQFLNDHLGSDLPAPLAVLFIDLDRFKPINDVFGHEAGDRMLKATAARLRAVVREGDLVARVGGDEFVLAVVRMRSKGEIETLCRTAIASVGAPVDIGGRPMQVSMSVGVAVAAADGDKPETLLRHADIAMYQAKREGGNAVRFFATDMNARVTGRLTLEHDLRRAMSVGEFALHYQPRFETATMRLRSVEALLRWNHPTRGLLSPPEFLAVAEESGIIVPLGAWVFDRACAVAARYPELAVSVNVSAAQLLSGLLVEQVEAALRTSGLPGTRLELELTESLLLRDAPLARNVLAAFNARGIGLAMDNFGSGHSSLGPLRDFAFDRLKLDRQLVADLHATGEARAIIQAILGLGRALDVAITAEGVETAEQLLLLRADGCTEVQGIYLSDAVPEDRLNDLLRPVPTFGRAAG